MQWFSHVGIVNILKLVFTHGDHAGMRSVRTDPWIFGASVIRRGQYRVRVILKLVFTHARHYLVILIAVRVNIVFPPLLFIISKCVG